MVDQNYIEWFDDDIVDKDIGDWPLITNGEKAGPRVLLHPGGYAAYNIFKKEKVTDPVTGETVEKDAVLSTSKYLLLMIMIPGYLENLYNYKNGIDISIVCTHSEQTVQTLSNSRAARAMRSSNYGSVSVFRKFNMSPGAQFNTGVGQYNSFVINMINKPLMVLGVTVTNNTDKDQYIDYCSVLKSHDIGTLEWNKINQQAASSYGLYVETRANNPYEPEVGRMWVVDTE